MLAIKAVRPLTSIAKLISSCTNKVYSFSTAAVPMAQEFKLKGLSALDLKAGEKREAEVEGVENGKVLLAKVGDKVHAMSANCTHFGAPLKNGVLSPEGKLICPWHGACFNVSSGDVEDAPALDPIAKFDIVQRDGAVFIQGEKQMIKAQRRAFKPKASPQSQEQVLIVGGGSGAVGTVEALREHNYKGNITVVSEEPNLPIDRTKLSKALIPDADKIILRPESWYKDAAVSVVKDSVASVDFSNKSVRTSSGKRHSYNHLVLSTGGTPKALPLPGFKDLKNVFLLRTVPDVQAILGAIGDQKHKKVVVVGSGFIGMEVGNALASKEHDVTIVGMESAPMERVMGAKVGKIFQGLLSKNGVKFHMEASVEAATPSSSDSNHVGGVKLKDGTVLPADLVILGVGVSPATTYLKDNPAVTLQKDGSVLVDETFAVKGADGAFAIGDIATFPYHGPGASGSLTRIEHWNVAQNSGRSVAASISGAKTSPPAKQFIPIFWSALGSQLRYCGNTPNGWDDLVLQGNPDENKFAAFYGKGDTVVAVASMMMDPVMSQSAVLMRRGKMPGMQQLRDGLDVRNVEIPAL